MQNSWGATWVSLMVLMITVGPFLGGCGPLSEEVKGKDNEVFFPEFRARLNFSPSQADFFFDGEIDMAYGAGSSSQEIGSGQFLQFADKRFDGPLKISADYNLNPLSVSVIGGMWLADIMAVEGIVGMGFDYLDLKLNSGSLSARDDTFSVGPLLGGQLKIYPVAWLSLSARGNWTLGFGDHEGSSFSAAEVGATVSPWSRLGFFGGWRWWHLEEDRRSNDGDVDLQLSGPTAGIRLAF